MGTEHDDQGTSIWDAPSSAGTALWLVALLLDDMSDHLGVRLLPPTVDDIVSYERRQAWVTAFLTTVQSCCEPIWKS